MSFKNDAINFAAKYIKSLGFKKSDFDTYGGLYNAVYSTEFASDYWGIVELGVFASQILSEISDSVGISDAEAISILENHSRPAEFIQPFIEYADLQGWDKSVEFAYYLEDNEDTIDSIGEIIGIARRDSELWEEVKCFVVDSILGDFVDFITGYTIDDSEFWDAIENKI